MQLLDHVSITVHDLERVKPFYLAVMSALRAVVAYERPDAVGFGERNRADDDTHSYLSVFESEESLTSSRRHWCFRASSTDDVDSFHAAGLNAGGTDDGAPGRRDYHPGYYGAFLLDPEGNRIEAVYHRAREGL